MKKPIGVVISVSIFLGIFLALPALAALNPEALFEEIRADAASQFSQVKNKTWVLKQEAPSTGCVQLYLAPEKAFQITSRSDGSQPSYFEITLTQPSELLTPFGDLKPLMGGVLACPQSNAVPLLSDKDTDLLGVQFQNALGQPIDLDRVAQDPQVSGFILNTSDPETTQAVFRTGNKAFFSRKKGYGTTDLTVKFRFNYQGVPYEKSATLPKREDGFRWKTEKVIDLRSFWEENCPSNYCITVSETHMTRDKALEDLKDRFYYTYYSECESFARRQPPLTRSADSERKYLKYVFTWNPLHPFDESPNQPTCRSYTDSDDDERWRCTLRPDAERPPVSCILHFEQRTLVPTEK